MPQVPISDCQYVKVVITFLSARYRQDLSGIKKRKKKIVKRKSRVCILGPQHSIFVGMGL